MKRSDVIFERHRMHTTFFLYLLALHHITDEAIQKHCTYETSAYHCFYHYNVDTTKRKQIEHWNQKNRLNQPKNGSFYSIF